MSRSTLRVPHLFLLITLFCSSFLLSGCALWDWFFPPEPEIPVPPITVPILAAPAAQAAVPTRLMIPAIRSDIPIVELGWSSTQDDAGRIFSEWDVADYAAGWHKSSAMAGQNGNVVLSGHNNIKGAVFRELDQLKKGDEIDLWANGKEFTYHVDKVLIVPEKYATANQRRKNAQWIAPTPDSRLTLVSCWPRDDNTHRIIVIALPAPQKTAQK
ncbi:MAG: sortase [Caldilineaceae bacterium]